MSTLLTDCGVLAQQQSSLCEQLGPDHNIGADEIEIKKVTVGANDGVSLKWSSTESGQRSFEVKIICGLSSLVGTATAGTDPVLEWTNPAVCDGPAGEAGPGDGPDAGGSSLEWGALTLIVLSVSGVLYVGGGSYRNKQAGAEGWDAMPNASFWSQLPGYVADGVYFSRMKLSAAHPSLEFLGPSGPRPSLAGSDEAASEAGQHSGKLNAGANRKGRGEYQALDEEAGGTAETTRLVGDGSSEPQVLLPQKGNGKRTGVGKGKSKPTSKPRVKAKANAKPKPKPPPSGRKPAASALE